MEKNRFRCEFEIPPHTKVRIVATVDRKLCEEMQFIHMQETERAKTEDRTESGEILETLTKE